MAWLILQILWFLVAAAAIGCAVGWLCRSLAIERRRETVAMQARATQGELEGQRERFEARLAEATAERKALQEEIVRTREAAETSAKSLRKLEREHSSTLIRLEAREREVARLSAELEARGHGASAQAAPSHDAPAPLESAEDTPASPARPASPDDSPDKPPQERPDDDGWRGKARVSGSFVQQK